MGFPNREKSDLTSFVIYTKMEQTDRLWKKLHLPEIIKIGFG